ncbi:MAG: LTA synthase family protein [Saprospiraceae bacterium]|nr:LTA synthase family protein [Saprospiraceae bacterium]
MIFIIYHFKDAQAIGVQNVLKSFTHGILLDASVAGYFSLIPFLLLAISALGFAPFCFKLIRFVTLGFVLISSGLIVTDLELYKNWGYRLDDSFLKYLSSPTEAAATISSYPVVTLTLCFGAFVSLSIYVFNQIFNTTFSLYTQLKDKNEPHLLPLRAKRAIQFTIGILLFFSLIIPIRGGLQLAPINQSRVYFSTLPFANHAAVNCVWNFIISTFEKSADTHNPFVYYEQKEAEMRVKSLFNRGADLDANSDSTTFLINPNAKTNVLIITYESLTAKVIERLGSQYKGITPNFDSLCREGVLFSNIYATGDRTDKGLIGVLSGQPAMPKVNIMETPRKTTQLPVLSAYLNKNGYSSAFYYGGETEFANMKSYLMTGGFSKIVDKTAFNKADLSSKWGAFDHVAFRRVNADLDKIPLPFFVNLLTLSSHEPFEVPTDWQQKNEPILDSLDDKFIRVHQYSDAALGEFIRTAKQKDWWKNTLIIIVADHSSQHLEPKDDWFERFHIPMLWLGGALTVRDTTIETIGSQGDIAATLLAQLRINQDTAFQFSKNILDSKQMPFAYFAFRQGFGFVQKNGGFVFDTEGGYIRQKRGVVDSAAVKTGKAYLQTTFQNYIQY